MDGFQCQSLWNNIKSDLEENYDEHTFNELFNNINKIHKFYNSYIYIIVENELILNRINRLHINKINSYIPQYTNDNVKFKFVVKEEMSDDPKNIIMPEKNLEEKYRHGNINATYTFYNFVVGKSNKFALQAAMKVADQPGITANPFYIFGDVGLGKTHLMQAIGNYILDADIKCNIFYTKADGFLQDYTRSLQKKEKMEEFEKKYNDLDVLLVDDIQLLAGAPQTQQAFFYLFEKLYQNNKQIIITSDRPASELKDIMNRLTNRFSGGLVVDITTPDVEHRIQILEKKLQQEAPKDNTFPKDVLRFIAESFPTNVRELEGALKKVLFYCVLNELDITIEHTKESLSSLLKTRKKTDELNENNYDKIQSIVADCYKISVSDLIGKSRVAHITRARHVAMYLLKNIYSLPYKKIGSLFSDRDHSTVLAACEKIDNDLKNDEVLRNEIEIIRKKMK